jgi:5-methylcytosine-specific restriction endonuclease McrA
MICKKCLLDLDDSQFYKTRNVCKACISIQNKKWQDANPDKVAQSKRKWQENNKQKKIDWAKNNPDKIRVAQRKYYDKNKNGSIRDRRLNDYKNNPEKYAEYRDRYRESKKQINAKWKQNNKELLRMYSGKRRALQNLNGIFYISQKEMIKLCNSPCVSCGDTANIEIDHIVPIIRGGRHSIGNLQPLCASCNRSKGSKLMAEWRLS